jgi:hypothetical protein
LINKLTDTLASPDVAIDERHTPKLYARFLNNLLAQQTGDGREGGGKDEGDAPGAGPSEGADDMSSGASDGGNPNTGPKSHSKGGRGLGNPSISVEYNSMDGQTHLDLLNGVEPPIRNNFESSTASSTAGGGETATQGSIHEGSVNSQFTHPDHMEQDEMLATMHLLSNSEFFEHMLMPPFNTVHWDDTGYQPPETYGGPQFPSHMDAPAARYYPNNMNNLAYAQTANVQ